MKNCFGVSDGTQRPRVQRVMDLGALSVRERAYLVGLYLADGTLRKHRLTSYELGFALQGNEMEIAERVVGMLRRSGLNPGIRWEKRSYLIRVTATGTNLNLMFPVKREVGSMSDSALRWIADEGVELPFVSGLLDGDGNTRVRHVPRGSIFGYVCSEWSFAQTKFPFLVDFFGVYVNGLANTGASVSTSVGVRIVSVLESGREALLQLGMEEWSYKVKDWLRRSEKLERWLKDTKSRFLTTGQAARRLGIGKWWVAKLCKLGRVKHLRIRSSLARGKNYYHIIPLEEVERLERERKKGGGWRCHRSIGRPPNFIDARVVSLPVRDESLWRGEDIHNSDSAELVASIQFLKENTKESGTSEEEIVQAIQKVKPHFLDRQIR